MAPRVLLIIQARSGSTRLPGKVCMELLPGRTLLGCLISRLQRSQTVTEIMVATTESAGDDAVMDIARAEGVSVFRGSEADVLGRFVGAARSSPADYIVRICADSPIHDADVVDLCVRQAIERPELDYVSNMHPETFPYGLAVEVLPMDVLLRLDRMAQSPEYREHVTYFIPKHPQLFLTHNVAYERDLSHFRVVVDYPEDLILARKLYTLLGVPSVNFSWRAAIRAIESDPQLQAINACRNDRLPDRPSAVDGDILTGNER